jgi:hypothetical protein
MSFESIIKRALHAVLSKYNSTVDAITTKLEAASTPEYEVWRPRNGGDAPRPAYQQLPHEASGFGRTPPAPPISNNTTASYSPSFAQRVAAREEYYPPTVVVVSRGFNGAPEFREIYNGEVIATKPVKKDVWKR